jgi:ribose transport system substrate-binding protein
MGIVAITFVIALASCRAVTGERDKISVIMSEPASQIRRMLENGAETAAVEYNMDISFVYWDHETAPYEFALENIGFDTKAIIFSGAADSYFSDAISSAKKSGVYVVIINGGSNDSFADAVINSDNYAAGEKAASEALKLEGARLLIGVVSSGGMLESERLCMRGFRDRALEDSRVSLYPANSENMDAEQLLDACPDLDAIAAFSERDTIAMGMRIKEIDRGDILAIGVDSGAESIVMLETGALDALVVQNPFAEGYLGVETVANLIRGGKEVARDLITEAVIATRDNMFDEDMQKILFLLDEPI